MIVVDSNVWIFAEDDTATEHDVAVQKLQEAISSIGFGINPVIVSEVFHSLSRLLGAGEAGRRVTNIVSHPAAIWLEFPLAVVQRALSVASQMPIRISDALIAQHALEAKAAVLTGNVKDFRKVKGLKVIPL